MMKTHLDYRKDFLCILTQYEVLDAGRPGTLIREWYPVRRADEAEVRPLLGRPVTEVDSEQGIFVDEEGTVFQLAEKGATKAIEVERSSMGEKAAADGKAGDSAGKEGALRANAAPARKAKRAVQLKTRRPGRAVRHGLLSTAELQLDQKERHSQENHELKPVTFAHLNLRQKLAVVRRRLAYVQKRGHNERHHYNYVTAADIAGAVGNILAELGVVVVPRLESISHEAPRPGRGEPEHVARVVMSYSFVDVDTAEEITVKTAGEGLDSGDKAPYKAMTGALKYALLQSFLLATGDDPEEERVSPNHSSPPTRESGEKLITADEVRELHQLIDDTGTELERVLAYYKLTSLEEMTEGTYRRAVELLQRKRSKQVREEATHAQN